MADPAVATAAYSYHGLRWAAARMAVRISGPPNVGKGELSRIARKNSPSAPKWRNIEAMLRPLFGLALWMRTFNMRTFNRSAIYEGTQFTSWKPTRRSSVRAGTASDVANRLHAMLTV